MYDYDIPSEIPRCVFTFSSFFPTFAGLKHSVAYPQTP